MALNPLFQTPKKSSGVDRKEEVREGWASTVSMSPPSRKFEQVVDGKKTLFFDHISVDDVERQMHEDGMQSYIIKKKTPPNPAQQIIYYLYGSGFGADDPNDVRTARMKKFLDLKSGAKDRILSIIQKESDQIENGELFGRRQDHPRKDNPIRRTLSVFRKLLSAGSGYDAWIQDCSESSKRRE
jgi:hypothetical protein